MTLSDTVSCSILASKQRVSKPLLLSFLPSAGFINPTSTGSEMNNPPNPPKKHSQLSNVKYIHVQNPSATYSKEIPRKSWLFYGGKL